jgi:CRISPR/Cas system-associated protein Cas10 (large subunit of type III CRISPR-Cas system)
MVAHNTTITPKASTKKARKGHSTDVIGNTSFVEIAINSKKAEVSSNFSSYQTLTTDVNSRRNYARKKLNKKLTLMSVNSCQ